MKNTEKDLLKIGLWLASIILIARCALSWNELKEITESKKIFELGYTVLGYAGEAIGITTIMLLAFNKWAWKWKPIRYLHKVPVLYNRYGGMLTSSYDESKKYDCSLEIEQTYTSVSVRLKTKESKSDSIKATICEINGSKRLLYTYQNDPQATIQDRSAIHYGTAILYVDDIKNLEGNYFTGRKTVGTLVLHGIEEQKKKKKE